MITPAPTTPIDPATARGTLAEIVQATATRPGYIVFAVPNTSYAMHLRCEATPGPERVGKRLLGTIRAQARRLDVVATGGRYVEPVMGRPRRVQGTVVRTESGKLVVDAGMPIHLDLTDERQKSEDFTAGQMVTCDVLDGATFTPQ